MGGARERRHSAAVARSKPHRCVSRSCSTDYFQSVSRQPRDEQDAYGTTGNMLSIAAGRISYTLGLQGPCLPLIRHARLRWCPSTWPAQLAYPRVILRSPEG